MRYLITSVLCVILLAACKLGPTTPTTTNEPDYFPLQVGNWWEYAILDSGDSILNYTKMEIIGDSLVNGIKYYIIQSATINSNSPKNSTSCVTKDKEGNIVWTQNIVPIDKYDSATRLLLYFNKAIHEEWTKGFQNHIFEISSKSYSIRVPAGFFYPTCVISEVQGVPESVTNRIFAPNVGLIAHVPVFLEYMDRSYLTRAYVNGKFYPN